MVSYDDPIDDDASAEARNENLVKFSEAFVEMAWGYPGRVMFGILSDETGRVVSGYYYSEGRRVEWSAWPREE